MFYKKESEIEKAVELLPEPNPIETEIIPENEHLDSHVEIKNDSVPVYFHGSQTDSDNKRLAFEFRVPLAFSSLEDCEISTFLDITAHDSINFPEIALDNANDYLDLLQQAGRTKEILEIYFKPKGPEPEYYCSSAMLNVTFALLDRATVEFKDKQLRKLLHYYSLCFSVSQLQLIRNRIDKFLTNCDPEHSPLLLTYLTGNFEKFQFYLRLGYDLDIPYVDVNRILFMPDDDNQVITYNANIRYIGKALRKVVEIQNPGLLKIAIPA